MSRARDRADGVLHNRTHEDTDGGRESLITFKGEQIGGEISTLAQIQASHDGTSDDEKADLIFKTNDGSDGASPTERMRVDSDGNIGVGINAPSSMLHLFDGGTDTGITLQSKVQANATSSLTMMSRDASNVNQTLTLKNIKGRLQSSAGIMFGSDTAVENALDDYEMELLAQLILQVLAMRVVLLIQLIMLVLMLKLVMLYIFNSNFQ